MLSEWLDGWVYDRFGPFLTALLDSLVQLVTSPRKGMDITVVFTRVYGWALENTGKIPSAFSFIDHMKLTRFQRPELFLSAQKIV